MQDVTTIWSAIGLIISGLLGGGLAAKKAGISITLSRSTEKQGDKTMPNGNESNKQSILRSEAYKEFLTKDSHTQICRANIAEIKLYIKESIESSTEQILKAIHNGGK